MFETTVTKLVEQVDGTLTDSEGRFPVYADPESGAWTWTSDGGWTGGFWGGLLWLAAAATGEDRYARDTSAAASAAAALTKLALVAGDGCYSHRQHLAERHELIWGDYFALEAMLAVDGVVDPGGL